MWSVSMKDEWKAPKHTTQVQYIMYVIIIIIIIETQNNINDDDDGEDNIWN